MNSDGLSALVMAYESPVPPHGGYRLRMLHLARAMAGRGRVDLAALGEIGDASDEPFSLIGVPHSFSRRDALRRSLRQPYLEALLSSRGMAEVAAGGSWDLVQISSPFFLAAAQAAGVPIVLDAHNVEADIMTTLASTERRRLHRCRWLWEARKLERVERQAAAAVDAIITTSEEDATRFRSWGARRVEVVANGVDTTAVAHRRVAPGGTIAYVGQYSYRPNEQAALELTDEILPLVHPRVPTAVVSLVGRNPTSAMARRAGPSVDVVGPVDDVLPHLHRARVLAVPLRAGSGTRLKILEAMAAGTPVVTTALGAAGIDAEPGEELLVGDTPAELAGLIADVIADDDLADRLSTRGRALVEARYDWNVLAPTMLDLHQELVATGVRR